MQYREYLPRPELATIVDRYWTLSGISANDEFETVCPDGHTEIIFNYGSLFRRLTSESVMAQPRAILVGQMLNATRIASAGEVGLFGIRFTPTGAWTAIRIPQYEFKNQILELGSVLGNNGDTLEKRMLAAANTPERIAIIESDLAELSSEKAADDSLSALVQNIIALCGRVPIENLARAAGLSTRQLERQFQQRVGIGPKTFSRIMRFQSVLKRIDCGRKIQWTDIAYDSGYFDQSHFIREFSAFSGKEPSAFLPLLGGMTRHMVRSDRMSHFYNSDGDEPI